MVCAAIDILIYNNIISMVSQSSIPIRICPVAVATTTIGITILNNTIITKGMGHTYQFMGVDSLIIKNNLAIIDNSRLDFPNTANIASIYFAPYTNYSKITYMDIDNNIYWKPGGAEADIRIVNNDATYIIPRMAIFRI